MDAVQLNEYLTLYDYGMGGVWTVIWAESADVIRRSYPELKILEAPPEWMTAEELADIRSEAVAVNDPVHPFLKALREGRDKSS